MNGNVRASTWFDRTEHILLASSSFTKATVLLRTQPQLRYELQHTAAMLPSDTKSSRKESRAPGARRFTSCCVHTEACDAPIKTIQLPKLKAPTPCIATVCTLHEACEAALHVGNLPDAQSTRGLLQLEIPGILHLGTAL